MKKGTQEKSKLTKEKLEKFIKVRNQSDYNSNMQFQIDADECGIALNDLGNAEKFMVDNIFNGYKWNTPFGTLIEQYGKLRLDK